MPCLIKLNSKTPLRKVDDAAFDQVLQVTNTKKTTTTSTKPSKWGVVKGSGSAAFATAVEVTVESTTTDMRGSVKRPSKKASTKKKKKTNASSKKAKAQSAEGEYAKVGFGNGSSQRSSDKRSSMDEENVFMSAGHVVPGTKTDLGTTW